MYDDDDNGGKDSMYSETAFLRDSELQIYSLVCYIIIFCLFQINIFDMMYASIEIH